MPDVLDKAASGRAKCRGCGRAIAKGELRFGEALPNPYAEGEALYWFHVPCAALMRPEKLVAALDMTTEVVDDVPWLRAAAAQGIEHRRVPRIARAERASSGRARCRFCHHTIEKGEFRLALQMFEEGRMNPIGTLHVRCSQGYFGTRDLLDRIVRLTPDLGESDRGEIAAALAQEPLERAEEEAPAAEEATPGLAKTTGPDGSATTSAEAPAPRRAGT